jgi:hypothetical protein
VAAPRFVPTKAIDDTRIYTSPPRRPEPWVQDRPAELLHGQEWGPRLGNPGPDQGFGLTIANTFRDRLVLRPGEHEDDVITGCLAVGLKRASIFGRAPVVHDFTIAFTIWGFLDDSAPDELVAVRRTLFEEVANSHHYAEQRNIADAVPESTLRLAPGEVTRRYDEDWRSLLDLPG